MTALSADKTNFKLADKGVRSYPVAAGVVIYYGAMVAVDSSGYARPARTSTTDTVIGYNWNDRVDNSTGSAGAKQVTVRSDRLALVGNSSAGDAIVAADVGDDCYAVDDQTVAKTNGTNTRVRAGKIYSVTSDGVFVSFDQ